MSKYVYLTCTPEALVASMLPPEGFGLYLSTGTKRGTKVRQYSLKLTWVKLKVSLIWIA
jgi:hypothetical protein